VTKKEKYRIIFWTLLVAALIIWNIAWPLVASVRARLYRSTSARKFNGSFHARYVIDTSILNPDADADYVNNPILWPYVILGSNAVVEINITSNAFIVAMEFAHGHTTESYSIGKDVFYLGDGLFTFYSSDFGLGIMSPGTAYSATACKITVSDKVISVEAEENHVGLSFFLFPVVQNRTFRRSLGRQVGCGAESDFNERQE